MTFGEDMCVVAITDCRAASLEGAKAKAAKGEPPTR